MDNTRIRHALNSITSPNDGKPSALWRRVSAELAWVGYRVDRTRWAVHTLGTYPAAPGGYNNLLQLFTAMIVVPLRAAHYEDRPTVTSGTWTSNTSTTTNIATTYGRTSTPGDSGTWVAPLGSTVVGMRIPRLNNAGWSTVQVTDLDTGKFVPITPSATLKTVQAWIDEGAFTPDQASAAGLAMGSYIFDGYSAGGSVAGIDYVFAGNLNPLHTYKVYLTATGQKRAESSDARTYFIGGVSDCPPDLIDDNTQWWTEATVGPLAGGMSAHEYAISARIGGVSATIGGVHGYENQVALSVRIDGEFPDIAATTIGTRLGRRVALTRGSDLYHPGSTGVVAAGITRYHVSPEGLWVTRRIDWSADAQISFAYLTMWPTSMTRFALSEFTTDVTALSNDLSRSGISKSDLVVGWRDGYAGLCEITTDTIAAWGNTSYGAFVEDRSATINKVYWPLVQVSEGDAQLNVAAGTRWSASNLYKYAPVPWAEYVLGQSGQTA